MNLPDKSVTLGETHSGANAWWSNNDQDYGDQRLTRTIDVPAGSDVRFWSWDDYTIEELWDYGFIEVSTDGGSSWTQLEVKDEAGNVVSTNEDPNGRLAGFGDFKNGFTGDTERLPARLGQPHAVRGQDDPAAAALLHGRRVPGARLVRRRLLGDERRRHGVVRRRRER